MSRIDNEADLNDIVGLCELMVVMLSQPDAESVLGGLHTAASITLEKARAVLARHYAAVKALRDGLEGHPPRPGERK